MRCILNNASLGVVEADSIQLDRAITDPVPTCTMKLYDQTSSLAVSEMQQLLVIDDQIIPNPTANILQNPTLNPYNSSGWSASALDGGVTLSQNSGGGAIFTISSPGGNLSNVSQNTQVGTISPGQPYCFSASITGSVTSGSVQAILYYVCYLTSGQSLSAAQSAPITPTGTPQTISISFTPPAGTTYIAVSLKFTYSGTAPAGTITYTNAQLEAQWFSFLTYPFPFCGPGQANCYQMPNSTWIRQYRKFAGFITKITYDNYRGNMRDITIEASGYAWLIGTRLTTNTYTNTYDSAIFSALASQYFKDAAGNNLFTTNHLNQGFQLGSIDYNYDDIRTCFDNLCTDSGFYWTIDAYQDIWYAAPGYYSQGITLICDNSAQPDFVRTFPAYNYSAERDFTQPGNSVLVIGAGARTTQLTAQLNSGTNYTSLSVNALPDTLSAGTTLTITDSHNSQTVTVSSQANADDVTISVSSFLANATYKVGTSVGIPQAVGRAVDANSIATYGYEFERKVNDSNLSALSDCVQRGEIELAQYNFARWLYHLSTNVELVPGESVALQSATENLSATQLLVQRISAKWLGTNEQLLDVWEYQADLGAINRDVTNTLVKLARETNKNPSGVASVGQTNLYMKEPLTVFEAYPPYQNVVLADVPLAYYRLDEASGTSAADNSGNSYTGTYSASGVTLAQAGALTYDPDTAALFDGIAGTMTCPSGVTIGGLTAISIEAWVKLSNTSFSAPATVAATSNATGLQGFNVQIPAGASLLKFNIGSGGSAYTLTTSYTFSAGTWYYIVATWDGSTMTLYVNGVSIGTLTLSGGSITAPSHAPAWAFNPTSGAQFLPGTLDEVALYTTALSAARVLAHYQAASALHSF